MSTTPDWHLTQTPQCIYNLTAFGPDLGSLWEVDMTLEEFDKLKEYLAQLRGLTIETADDDGSEAEPE